MWVYTYRIGLFQLARSSRLRRVDSKARWPPRKIWPQPIADHGIGWRISGKPIRAQIRPAGGPRSASLKRKAQSSPAGPCRSQSQQIAFRIREDVEGAVEDAKELTAEQSPVQELPDCFASFGPTDADLREFAADMEALLGQGLDDGKELEDSFYMEALGLISPPGEHGGRVKGTWTAGGGGRHGDAAWPPRPRTDEWREARVSRYREKRRTRLFAKKIRYEVRKLNAEKRPRMKGRFVKRTGAAAAAGAPCAVT
ncbi:Zinc finger protein CONSTANS-LIKE 6 [Triticum urartu]|uniref:Zinc finger protein CONSTANS-LIKE 6 n=1 Tax=Triticum urartu TaxID=4572 RepID=M7ZTE7_TRIUA|nr:Zinc finger protein CONSTANS-LIKE 6 [Triticum urartu]